MTLPLYTLYQLRTLARKLSDMEHSEFVSDTELNAYLNLGTRELYDELVIAHGQEYYLKAFPIALDGITTVLELPGDIVSLKGVDWSPTPFPASSTTEVVGGFPLVTTTTTIDSGVPATEIQSTPLRPYTFENRNRQAPFDSRYVGGLAPQYRMFTGRTTTSVDVNDPDNPPAVVTETEVWGNFLRLSSATQGYLLVWYLPEVPRMVDDTDSVPFFHGFEEYPALVAATMMLAKENSDTGALMARKGMLQKRIKTMANNRDIGHPEQVQDVMEGGW